MNTEIQGRATGEGDEEFFSGDSKLYIADFVYKWNPANAAFGRSIKVQGEYFHREETGAFTSIEDTALGYDGTQTGWYLEGVYQFRPSWRAGVRHSEVEADDPGALFIGSSLDTQVSDSSQNSVMLDWTNSEFSRIRLQYNREKLARESEDIWTLQYIMSLGAHASHSF